MKSAYAGLVAAGLLALAACDQAAPPRAELLAAAPQNLPPPPSERAGPVRWNGQAGAFEMDGRPLRAVRLWTFQGSTDGFTTPRSEPLPAPGEGMWLKLADPTLRSPRGLSVDGSYYSLVLVRLTRLKAGQTWDGALYYTTAAHPETAGYFGKPLHGADPRLNETTTLVYDMSRQAAGGDDWKSSLIDQIRLDLEGQPGGEFLIRQVAIVENPNRAGATQVAEAETP